MTKVNFFIAVAFCIFFLACEKDTFYSGTFVIVNECDESIDSYAFGINAPGVGPSFEIHDHLPAHSTLDLRKIRIIDKAKVSDIFKYIKIYQNGQISIKDPMNQQFWNTTIESNQITHTLVVDSSFFKQ
jgi:hypothetical protein